MLVEWTVDTRHGSYCQPGGDRNRSDEADAADEGSDDLAVATDGDTIAGQSTTAAISDDGSVAADADGDVGEIVSETLPVVDADGNATVARAVEAGVVSIP